MATSTDTSTDTGSDSVSENNYVYYMLDFLEDSRVSEGILKDAEYPIEVFYL